MVANTDAPRKEKDKWPQCQPCHRSETVLTPTLPTKWKSPMDCKSTPEERRGKWVNLSSIINSFCFNLLVIYLLHFPTKQNLNFTQRKLALSLWRDIQQRYMLYGHWELLEVYRRNSNSYILEVGKRLLVHDVLNMYEKHMVFIVVRESQGSEHTV